MCKISNYYNGTACQPCASGGILECYGPLSNNAFTCTNSMTLCNGACFCNNYYYWNGTKCSPCYSSCLSCSGPLISDCLVNATSNYGTCIAGYFIQTSTCGITKYQNCIACDPSCLTCSNSTDCTSCMQNATLQPNNTCLCSQG